MLSFDVEHIYKVLLITEASLSKEAGGIGQTLYNLLADYPTACIRTYSPVESLREQPPSAPFENTSITYPKDCIPLLNNRIGKLINPSIQKINIQLHDWLPLQNIAEINKFSPDIILICPNGPLSLVKSSKVLSQLRKPYLIYFMDDWMDGKNLTWFTGDLQSLIHKTLANAQGWIMISEPLKKILSERYGIEPKRTLIAHNPVTIVEGKPEYIADKNNPFRIIYAGSIWPMHYDALLLVAQAVHQLKKKEIDIELILFTKKEFWKYHQFELNKLNVIYEGYVPYDKLNEHLQTGDLLLVTSSFLPEHASFSRASVQTKITDYMKSRVPMLSVGPEYSACNAFIKQWQCGLTFEKNKISSLEEFLAKKIQEHEQNKLLAQHAFQIVKEHFSEEIVKVKFYQFIQDTVSNSVAYAKS